MGRQAGTSTLGAWLDWLLGWVTGAMLLVIVTAVFLQVVFRYVLRSPLSWSEELARYLFVWCGFLGAALAAMRGAHFAIDLLTIRLPPPVQRLLAILLDLVFAALFGLIARQSLRVLSVVHLQESATLEIPMSWAHAGIFASSVLLCAILAGRAWRRARGTLRDPSLEVSETPL